jgi:Tfp pilus assembly protein PilX
MIPAILSPSSRRRTAHDGFALVIALSLMAFVLLLLLSITTLVQVETRSAAIASAQVEAEQAALLGLQLAIGELQKAAGPDQRVTAVADILTNDGSKAPVQGRNRWAGVWDTSTYSPATPSIKTFKSWLVSSSLPNGLTSDTDANSAVNTNPHTIFAAVDASGNRDLSNDVIVEKIPFSSAGSLSESYYAYWVEDEGVKADLSWNEGTFTDDERKQAARLSAAPGVDYDVFASDATSPFNGLVAHPLEKDASNNSWLVNMSKAVSTVDLPLVTESNSDASDWLKAFRHDITFGSRAVLADVKKGGLRRDLSLAFEMDGDADVSLTEQTTLFNLQEGEFVGSGNAAQDPLSATQKPDGLPVHERFLWRDFNEAGNTFSASIHASGNSWGETAVMRGPNWWALRDYANLYKRLSGTTGNYTMQARAYYPNRSSEDLAYSDYHSHFRWGQTWDQEIGHNDSGASFKSTINTNATGIYYLYRPAAANYAPVNLGVSFLVGLQARNVSGVAPDETAELAVTLDPLFYFWNPYNRKIFCENIAVSFSNGVPGRVVFDATAVDGSAISEDLTLFSLLKNNISNKIGNKILYLIKGPFTLEPGEVVIASPIASPGGGTGTGEAILGYATNNFSGIIMTKLDGDSPIRVPLDSTVSFSYIQSKNSEGSSGSEVRHDMDTSLPLGSVTLASLVADMTTLGEQTQHNLQVLWSGSAGPSAYVNPEGKYDSTIKVRTELVNNMINTKLIFGAHALLIKPASAGAPEANPFEMFARLNPAPMLMKRDTYVRSYPNQIYRHITANSEFSVRDQMGIDFSGSPRGTFWGLSYQNTGSTSVPMSNIPTSPLLSLADFAHANLSMNATDPFHAVGNSWSNIMVSPSSTYGRVSPATWQQTTQDFSWLINDSLFDRYYLSGIAPEFSIGSGGYNASGTLAGTLNKFYGVDSSLARANPALEPYLPEGKTASDIVSELTPSSSDSDGYKKLGAYSLVKGAFNVNSTSVSAWEALLRANRGLDVDYAQGGGSDTDNNKTPFPSSGSPSAPVAQAEWSGLSRLSDSQISGLAQQIVDQVKLRGPFMSLSDFVNHRVGPLDAATSYTGALQAAIDMEAGSGGSGINAGSRAAAANPAAVDANALTGTLAPPSVYVPFPGPSDGRKSTTGIPGDITQADILRPIAPRLNARSDTFRIRAYGEVQDSFGNVSSAICEAVVQRLPEYLEQGNSVGGNDPWDDGDTLTSDRPLGTINQQFGRRFKIHSVRWLNSNDV